MHGLSRSCCFPPPLSACARLHAWRCNWCMWARWNVLYSYSRPVPLLIARPLFLAVSAPPAVRKTGTTRERRSRSGRTPSKPTRAKTGACLCSLACMGTNLTLCMCMGPRMTFCMQLPNYVQKPPMCGHRAARKRMHRREQDAPALRFPMPARHRSAGVGAAAWCCVPR